MTTMASPDDNIPNSNHKKVILAMTAFILATIATLAISLRQNPNQSEDALAGKNALDFQVEHISGQAPQGKSVFGMQDFIGKPLILNFWASWCTSCRHEAKELEAFWQKYQDQGIQVVGIAVQDSQEAAHNFLRDHPKSYLLGLDKDSIASINYGVTGVPETVLIDKHGRVVEKFQGPLTVAKLEKKLALIMK